MNDKKLILVIDDDPDIIDSLEAILTESGFNVVTALNGAEGIAMYKQNNPDLVLCDMMMEHIDEGTNVASEIRKQGSHVPIYLLSSIGNATASNIEIDKLGFNGVFQKPVSASVLIESINRVLKTR